MTCYDVRAKLSALLDGAVEADEKGGLTRHVDACADCRAELQALAATDRVLRQAMSVAVESSAPSGYFDSFAARVMERAGSPGAEDVKQDEQDKQEVGVMDVITKPTPKVEMTGLHDLQALARNTKERLAQKHPDESEDLMAQVSASGSFGRVLLPQPDREVAPSLAASAAQGVAAAPSAQMAATTRVGSGIVGRRPSRLPAVIMTTVVVVAAAGVAAWFVVPKYLAKEQAQPAQAVAVAEQKPPPSGDEPAKEAEAPAPAAAPTVEPIAPEAPAAGDTTVALADPKAEEPARENKRERGEKDRDKAKDKEKAARAEVAKAEPSEAPPPPSAAKPAAPKEAAKENPELDELLNQASGAPAGGAPAPAQQEEKAAKPDEKLPESLTSKQVRDGMNLVKARVQACYTQYKVPGVVEIKVRIDRDGSVTAADATGKFAATETGLCVANAVKHAPFPSFSGPPMSFTYPFRLQ